MITMKAKKDLHLATQLAASIRLLCLDVDGTLTDGRLYVHNGAVGRAFSVLDGLGIQRFITAGGTAAIITAADEEHGGVDIRLRAQQIGIRHIYIGVKDKLAVMQQLCLAEQVTTAETAFVGDDLPDLPPMQHAGFAAAPASAVTEILSTAHYIATAPAGGGAVREICEFILQAQQTTVALK